MLRRGTPKTKTKLDKDGKPLKDKHGNIVTETVRDKSRKIVYEPYEIKVLNTIDFSKSMRYNPFAYIRTEKDILKLVTALIENTRGEQKGGDPFWEKAEILLYCALIGYIHFEGEPHEKNMNTLVGMINSMEVREDDETFCNSVDYIFLDLGKEQPNHFAVRQYQKYKLAAGVICSKGHSNLMSNKTRSHAICGTFGRTHKIGRSDGFIYIRNIPNQNQIIRSRIYATAN